MHADYALSTDYLLLALYGVLAMEGEDIFLNAIEIESCALRAAYLDEACCGDSRLRADVDSLLRHHELSGQFLELPPEEMRFTFTPNAELIDTVRNRPCEGQPDRWEAPLADDGARRLGPYELLDIIGYGGMGVVLRARDPRLDRIVAIKQMNESLLSSPTGAKRFLQEAQAVAAVKSDHIVTIHAIHDEETNPFLVMELVEGASLQEKVDTGERLTVAQIVDIGKQLAAGLSAAHQRGLVHRDIKPANILIEKSTRRVKITDFGLAGLVGDSGGAPDRELAGTPQYMPPEHARGLPSDHRGDLYSLGSVLYTLCTGQPALPADKALVALRGTVRFRIAPIRHANPQIPIWLEDLITRLMASDPDDRPQSAAEVFEHLARGERRTGATDERLSPDWQTSSGAERWRSRRFAAVSLAAGTIVFLLAGILIVVQYHGRVTRVVVPDGSNVRVTQDGAVVVDLPEALEAPAEPAAFPPVLTDVADQLIDLNPGFDGQLEPLMVHDRTVGLRLLVDHVTDLTPLKQLADLRFLECVGTAQGLGRLADLSPLRGVPLQRLNCTYTQVADLTPLQGMPLEQLSLGFTKVSDLTPLHGMPLTHLFVQNTGVNSLTPVRECPLLELNVSATQIVDLSPLKGMKLVAFYCDHTHATDLSPLADMPLKNLNWRGYDQNNPNYLQVIRSLSSLESIDSLPTAVYWRERDTK